MDSMNLDVSGGTQAYARIIRRVEALASPDRETLLEFDRRLKLDRVEKAKRRDYLQRLLVVMTWLEGKPLKDLQERDVEDLVTEVDQRDYTEETKANYRAALRKFTGYKWIRTTARKNRLKLPWSLVTEAEVMAMAGALEKLRDRTILIALYDLGCRPAELLSRRLEHVLFDETSVVVLLEGKTGPRRVRGILSTPYLRQWVQAHPSKDPGAPLWPSDRSKYGVVMVGRLQKIVKRAARRAKIGRRIWPYLSRHSRATHNASFLTEQQLCILHGWEPGSRMPGRYVHLSGRDVDGPLLSHYGLRKEELPGGADVRRCPRCQELNQGTVSYCARCGLPLDLEAAEEYEAARKELRQLLYKEERERIKMEMLAESGTERIKEVV